MLFAQFLLVMIAIVFGCIWIAGTLLGFGNVYEKVDNGTMKTKREFLEDLFFWIFWPLVLVYKFVYKVVKLP